MADPGKPAIAITMGDPCGIGPEVVVKALADPRVYASCRPLVVGNAYAIEQAVRISSRRAALCAYPVAGTSANRGVS